MKENREESTCKNIEKNISILISYIQNVYDIPKLQHPKSSSIPQVAAAAASIGPVPSPRLSRPPAPCEKMVWPCLAGDPGMGIFGTWLWGYGSKWLRPRGPHILPKIVRLTLEYTD